MHAELSIHLGTPGETLEVRKSSVGPTKWLAIECSHHGSMVSLAVFGTDAELDAFIDRVTALRTKQEETTV